MPLFGHHGFIELPSCFLLAGALIASGAEVSPSQPPVTLPPVTVTGSTNAGSLTSPPISQATRKKKEIPGGFTVQGIDCLNQGRASSIDDFFQNAPGLVL